MIPWEDSFAVGIDAVVIEVWLEDTTEAEFCTECLNPGTVGKRADFFPRDFYDITLEYGEMYDIEDPLAKFGNNSEFRASKEFSRTHPFDEYSPDNKRKNVTYIPENLWDTTTWRHRPTQYETPVDFASTAEDSTWQVTTAKDSEDFGSNWKYHGDTRRYKVGDLRPVEGETRGIVGDDDRFSSEDDHPFVMAQKQLYGPQTYPYLDDDGTSVDDEATLAPTPTSDAFDGDDAGS